MQPYNIQHVAKPQKSTKGIRKRERKDSPVVVKKKLKINSEIRPENQLAVPRSIFMRTANNMRKREKTKKFKTPAQTTKGKTQITKVEDWTAENQYRLYWASRCLLNLSSINPTIPYYNNGTGIPAQINWPFVASVVSAAQGLRLTAQQCKSAFEFYIEKKKDEWKKEIKSKTPEDRDMPTDLEPIYDQPLHDYKRAIEPPLTLSKIDDKNSNIISRFNSLLSCKEVRKKHTFQSFSPEKYKTYNETQRETLASRARVDFNQSLTPLDFVKKSANHGHSEPRHHRPAYRTYTPTISSRKIQTPVGRSPSQTPPRQSPVNVTSPENYSQQNHIVVTQPNVMKVGPQNVVLMKKQNSNQQLVYVQTNRVGGQVRTADGKIVQHQPVIISGDPMRRVDGKKMVYVNHPMHKIGKGGFIQHRSFKIISYSFR